MANGPALKRPGEFPGYAVYRSSSNAGFFQWFCWCQQTARQHAVLDQAGRQSLRPCFDPTHNSCFETLCWQTGCRKSKNKCEGEAVCSRCKRLNLDCTFDRAMPPDPYMQRLIKLESEMAIIKAALKQSLPQQQLSNDTFDRLSTFLSESPTSLQMQVDPFSQSQTSDLQPFEFQYPLNAQKRKRSPPRSQFPRQSRLNLRWTEV